MSPDITVVIPSYNQGDYITKCVESALALSRVVKVIVVDNLSTDSTKRNLDAIKDSRLLVISEPDKGQSDALNKGLRYVETEFIGWQNSDDYYTQDCNRYISSSRWIRDAHSADVIYGDQIVSDEAGATIALKVFGEFSIEMHLRHGFCITNQSAFYRTSSIKSISGWDSNLHFAMDHDFHIRLKLSGAKFLYRRGFWGVLRVYNMTKSKTLGSVALAEMQQIKGKFNVKGGANLHHLLLRFNTILMSGNLVRFIMARVFKVGL